MLLILDSLLILGAVAIVCLVEHLETLGYFD